MPDSPSAQWFTLRSLGLLPRLGLAATILVFLGGFAASLMHMKTHHAKKDEEPGLSLLDLQGQYHGVRAPSPLVGALERGHPKTGELSEAGRTALLDWLLGKNDAQGQRPKGGGPRIAEDFDNLDLGDNAPAEIMTKSCLSCHKRGSSDPVASKLPLEYWDDVKKIAYSKELSPVSTEVLAASTHTHALSLAAVTAVVALLAFGTRWPRGPIGLLVCLAGVGLLVDLAAWWLARESGAFVYALIIGGAAFNGSVVVLLLTILADLMLPTKKT